MNEQDTIAVMLYYRVADQTLVGIQSVNPDDNIRMVGHGFRDVQCTTADVPIDLACQASEFVEEIIQGVGSRDRNQREELKSRLLMLQMKLHPFLNEEFRYQFEANIHLSFGIKAYQRYWNRSFQFSILQIAHAAGCHQIANERDVEHIEIILQSMLEHMSLNRLNRESTARYVEKVVFDMLTTLHGRDNAEKIRDAWCTPLAKIQLPAPPETIYTEVASQCDLKNQLDTWKQSKNIRLHIAKCEQFVVQELPRIVKDRAITRMMPLKWQDNLAAANDSILMLCQGMMIDPTEQFIIMASIREVVGQLPKETVDLHIPTFRGLAKALDHIGIMHLAKILKLPPFCRAEMPVGEWN